MQRPGFFAVLSSLATAIVGIGAGSDSGDLVPVDPATLVARVVAASPVVTASTSVSSNAIDSARAPEETDETLSVVESVEPEAAFRVVGADHDPSIGECRWFNGRPIRAVRSMRMRVTSYSPDHRSCGADADGITASGYSVEANGGRLVAADAALFPFGSMVSVPGYAGGQVVPVLDRGGAIKGSRLDVLHATHEIACEWGVQHLDVTVWEYADGRPIGYRRPKGR